MKKSLIAFYAKIAIAVGMPVLCVAGAVALFSNDEPVNQEEVHIIESVQSLPEESDGFENIVTSQADFSETAVSQSTGATVATQTAQAEPATEAPTKPEPTEPIPTEPVTEAPTKPMPTEPVTEVPTKPEPTTGSFEVKYTYDLLGRVIKAEYENYILEYIYDSNGNIVKINKVQK